MKNSCTKLEICTLGRFSISIGGKQVAAEWPDESIKVIFCSLFSPMDIFFTWEGICRSMWNILITQTNTHRLEELFIQPLNSFLIKELGFNPLITGHEGIRINQKLIHLDASEFHHTVVEGKRLMACGNYAAALTKFNAADSLYTGSYLPGVPGKIIENTRNDIDTIYRTMVNDALPFIRNAGFSNWNSRAEPRMYLMSA